MDKIAYVNELAKESHEFDEEIRGKVEELYRDHFGWRGLPLANLVREFCDWWHAKERECANEKISTFFSNPGLKK